MEKRTLGKSGISVSRLCFGTLPMGPLQRNMDPGEGADLLRRALDYGVNFFDTAESYRTHACLARALAGRETETVVATKAAAADYGAMRASVEKARLELGRDRLDIVLLHAPRAADPFRERAGALECLNDCRAKNLVRATGVSTHRVDVVRQAGERPDIDIIHPLVNLAGLGIIDGGPAEMATAIAGAAARGKGIYGMKALAGGNLADRAAAALRFALSLKGMHSFAVGMVSLPELEANARFFSGGAGAEDLLARVERQNKKLVILTGLCRRCGACARACPSRAISLAGGPAQVDPEKCVLCGYCGPACPEFAIRIA